MKIIQVLNNLRSMLSRNGKIIFSVPLGYNPYMDDIIIHEKLNLNEQYYFKRISKGNQWKESKLNKTNLDLFNKPYQNGNGIIVGIIINKR